MTASDAPLLHGHGRRFLAAMALLYVGGGGVIYWLLDETTLQKLRTLPVWLVGALLALSLVNYLIRAWRWIMLTAELGLEVPSRANLLYYLAGFALTATPGKAGETVRLWFLKKAHDVPYTSSLPLMLADRLLDTWSVVLLVLLSLVGFSAYLWQGAVLALVVAALSVPLLFPGSIEPLLRRALPRNSARVDWLLTKIRHTAESMQKLRTPRTYATLIPSIVGWAAECLALYLLLRHFETGLTLVDAIFVFSFSVAVGAASMLPGGLGGAEVTSVILLKALGVPLDVALACTAIIRVTTFWFAVALGAAIVPYAVRRVVQPAALGR